MSFILCTSGAIVNKAGINVSSYASTSGAILEQFSNEAEGYICALTRFDWVGNYATISANFKPVLAEAAASIGGAALIAYDMSGYTTRGEAESMINVLYDRSMKAIEALKDSKVKNTMGVTTA